MQLVFSESVPAPLDIQWPKCFQLQGGFAPLPRALPLDTAGGSAVLRTRHGPPQPLTPSAAYGPPLEKNPVGAPDQWYIY